MRERVTHVHKNIYTQRQRLTGIWEKDAKKGKEIDNLPGVVCWPPYSTGTGIHWLAL